MEGDHPVNRKPVFLAAAALVVVAGVAFVLLQTRGSSGHPSSKDPSARPSSADAPASGNTASRDRPRVGASERVRDGKGASATTDSDLPYPVETEPPPTPSADDPPPAERKDSEPMTAEMITSKHERSLELLDGSIARAEKQLARVDADSPEGAKLRARIERMKKNRADQADKGPSAPADKTEPDRPPDGDEHEGDEH